MILAVITTYKRPPEMLERAIKSVVNQTYKDWHLLIVDDSPQDYILRNDVKCLAEKWCAEDERITYIQHDKNYGVSHARNTALNFAMTNNYELIAYLDDDDEWLPEKLAEQLEIFAAKSNNTALVYCDCCSINDDTGNIIKLSSYELKPDDNLYRKLFQCNFIPMTALVRTKCLADAGGFDEEINAFEDWEAWIRLAKNYEFAYINKSLAKVHLHDGEHVSSNNTNLIKACEVIISKNKDYLAHDKLSHWYLLVRLAYLYREDQHYKKCLFTLLKALSLRPYKINIIAKALFTIKFKKWLRSKIFFWKE